MKPAKKLRRKLLLLCGAEWARPSESETCARCKRLLSEKRALRESSDRRRVRPHTAVACPTLFCFKVHFLQWQVANVLIYVDTKRRQKGFSITRLSGVQFSYKLILSKHFASQTLLRKRSNFMRPFEARALVNIGASAYCWHRNLSKTWKRMKTLVSNKFCQYTEYFTKLYTLASWKKIFFRYKF